ncbi:hypothetical protein F511_40668 [Dorcoceras hygrometricum]|uniref:Uncharacterized protein n=1 Tax=Dorcoceras hygrometricum TaxID=472368 RepID=A0A2Z7BVG8_9LAMI|nr:hypothetical protein F511_40668 [Dorcoceras hygrometricum]
MHVVASSDHPRLPSFALYAPATMAVAPPAGPPPGPACPNHTSLGPNHGPQGSKEASQERLRKLRLSVTQQRYLRVVEVARSSLGARLSDRVYSEAVYIKSSSGTFLQRKKGRRRI